MTLPAPHIEIVQLEHQISVLKDLKASPVLGKAQFENVTSYKRKEIKAMMARRALTLNTLETALRALTWSHPSKIQLRSIDQLLKSAFNLVGDQSIYFSDIITENQKKGPYKKEAVAIVWSLELLSETILDVRLALFNLASDKGFQNTRFKALA